MNIERTNERMIFFCRSSNSIISMAQTAGHIVYYLNEMIEYAYKDRESDHQTVFYCMENISRLKIIIMNAYT